MANLAMSRLWLVLIASDLATTFVPVTGPPRCRAIPRRADATVEDVVVESLQRLAPPKLLVEVDWDGMRKVLKESAYLSHKDWAVTRQNAARLAATLPPVDSEAFQTLFSRILIGGGWKKAPTQAKPWVVLVGGLNGIRKTTSCYMPWMEEVLTEALAAAGANMTQPLPTGSNSFFRQLDFIMATIANVEFEALYSETEIGAYAAKKAVIFGKYRTAAELFGLVFLEAARAERKNVMFETSGRDKGMFEFVDEVYDDDVYQKLVIYFAVDDIEHAMTSVDNRMVEEMALGGQARGVEAIVAANCGGPYGSDVLKSVHEDSLAVWRGQVLQGGVASDWHKAVIRIHSSDKAEEWTARGAFLNDVDLRLKDDVVPDDVDSFSVFAFGSQ